MGDEVRDGHRDLRHHRQARVLGGVVGGDLVEDVHEHRDDHRDHHDHHGQCKAEDDRRIGHRRAHLTMQGVEPLELIGDSVERIVEPSRVLPGTHDGSVEGVEYPGLGLHRLGHRASGLDVLANADDRLLEHFVLGLRLERVKRAQHRHSRTDQGCELAREDGEGTQVDALEALQDALELHRLALLGDVEDDQAPLAQLLGHHRLRRSLHLAARRDAGQVHGPERERAHRPPIPLITPRPPGCGSPGRRPKAASAPPEPRPVARRGSG